ncbi:hypothetical protein S40288_09075, partial [Stachybotrys chartarum IBT 40288]
CTLLSKYGTGRRLHSRHPVSGVFTGFPLVLSISRTVSTLDTDTSMATTNPTSIAPAKEASQGDFFRRQLRITPPAVTRADADLAGKVAIITGGNSGLGFNCGKQLLSFGLRRLIITARDEPKGLNAQKSLAQAAPAGSSVEVWPLDLANYDSINSFVNRAKALDRLDIVILSAGTFSASFRIVPETNHEMTVQVNYISDALLTILLLPVLKAKKAASPSRLIWVNSETAAWAKFKERTSTSLLTRLDTKPAGSFDPIDRYYTSKLLGQLFIVELARRVSPDLAEIAMVNPGLCYGSTLHREASGVSGVILGIFKRTFGRTLEVGARTLTDAAVKHGPEIHGQYLGDCVLKPLAPLLYEPDGAKLANQLWTETLTDLSFANAEQIIAGLSR